MKRSAKGGYRDDIQLYVRSRYEANYCRYLNWLVDLDEIKSWEYEPDEFEFPVKRGTRFYRPDFKIINSNDTIEYHEIKGYMDAKSATQLRRMAKFYPDIKIIVIDNESYHSIAKSVKGFIPEWE